MTERKKRGKVPNTESLTMGNCTISLTLDTRYRDDNGKYHASIRFTVNGSRYFFHLGNKYTVDEFDAISKADGRGRGGNQSLGMFLAQYLCNGCNLYDLALLRYEDYYDSSEHKALRFYRHKTKDHSESGSEVIIPIIPPLKRILDDWATPAKKGEQLFPFLLGESIDPDSKKARDKIHQELHQLCYGPFCG